MRDPNDLSQGEIDAAVSGVRKRRTRPRIAPGKSAMAGGREKSAIHHLAYEECVLTVSTEQETGASYI